MNHPPHGVLHPATGGGNAPAREGHATRGSSPERKRLQDHHQVLSLDVYDTALQRPSGTAHLNSLHRTDDDEPLKPAIRFPCAANSESRNQIQDQASFKASFDLNLQPLSRPERVAAK
jgi:hypothetical protein